MASPARKQTLLVVDDEEGLRELLSGIFEDEYEVWFAHDGALALELARRHQIDVAVLDIRMAGMSGIDLLERLKSADPSIEVVMMTAFETTDTMRQALRLRACDYIKKPFTLSTMRAAVARAMDRHSLESENRSHAEQLQELLAALQSHKIRQQLSRAQREIEISRRHQSFLRRQSHHAARAGVNELLADLDQLLRPHPALADNQLEVRGLVPDVVVQAHGTHFIQILLNLAVNAFECAPEPHRVEIQARVMSEPLDLAPLRDGPQDRLLNADQFDNTAPLLAVSVRDSGPGIPPGILARIFQPYFTTKPPGHWTGLGLSIVLRLVKTAKGLLHVHTELGVGTTFTAYVPVRRAKTIHFA